jgi:lipoprotein-anchoring transpeptidase ErfK/SrfK
MVNRLASARKQLQWRLIFMPGRLRMLLCAVLLTGLVSSISAQFRLFGPRQKPTPQPMRQASAYISRQQPLKVNQSLLKQATPDNVHVIVSLPKQRAYLMIGEQIVADSPISSGKAGHSTPSGHFSVLEKDPDHRSSIYGDFVDSSGRVVRAGISAKIDSAPSGTHYVGASMRWFMRLTGEGVGMHVGILPGYPASHGCVRMSSDGAKLFYDNVKIGTPVNVGDY